MALVERFIVKFWIPALAAFIGLLAIGMIGCGGGGGTGSGGNGGSGGTIVRYKVEATLNGSLIDPGNIQTGENVQFLVAGFTASNARVVQSSNSWTTTDTTNSAGVLTSGGQFSATGVAGPFTVSAISTPGQVTGAYQTKPVQALVSGTLIDGQGRNVEGVQVLFYDAGGTVVGSSTSQSNGFFRASVPTTATTFDINKNTIDPTKNYNEFFYNGKWYLPPGGACRPAITGLANGATKALGSITIPATTAANGSTLPPPPPPTGCG